MIGKRVAEGFADRDRPSERPLEHLGVRAIEREEREVPIDGQHEVGRAVDDRIESSACRFQLGLAPTVGRDVRREDRDAIRYRMGGDGDPAITGRVIGLKVHRDAGDRPFDMRLERRAKEFRHDIEQPSADQCVGVAAREDGDAGLIQISDDPVRVEHEDGSWRAIQHAVREHGVGRIRSCCHCTCRRRKPCP